MVGSRQLQIANKRDPNGNIMGGVGMVYIYRFSAQIWFLLNLREFDLYFDLCELEVGFNVKIEHFKLEFLVISWGLVYISYH